MTGASQEGAGQGDERHDRGKIQPGASTSPKSPEIDYRALGRYGLNADDLKFLLDKGIDLERVQQVLDYLSKKPDYPTIVGPSRKLDDTIKLFTAEELQRADTEFNSLFKDSKIEVVVPAGGAATRMLSILKTILSDEFEGADTAEEIRNLAVSKRDHIMGKKEKASKEEIEKLPAYEEIRKWVVDFWENGIKGRVYAFCSDLETVMADAGEDFNEEVEKDNIKSVVQYLMKKPGLNYEKLPKLLMKFHAYQDQEAFTSRTALEEHIREAALLYSGLQKISLHFIVSPEHEKMAQNTLRQVLENPRVIEYLQTKGFTPEQVEASFSLTDPSLDAVALSSSSGKVARDLHKRPRLANTGHGAVLKNVSAREVDGLWLNNVDNILYDRPEIKEMVVAYKRAMATLATELNQQAVKYIEKLEVCEAQGLDELIFEVKNFLESKLQIQLDDQWFEAATDEEVKIGFIKILNRPVTVAGFVPLEPGQAGGGPFLIEKKISEGLVVKNASILEQVEFPLGKEDPGFQNGSYFNPVMMFCSLLGPNGHRHNLADFANHDRGFMTTKPGADGCSQDRIYQDPGLWNGGIEGAIHVCVALPCNVFAAVKTIVGNESLLSLLHKEGNVDLLRELDFGNVVDHETADYLRERGKRAMLKLNA